MKKWLSIFVPFAILATVVWAFSSMGAFQEPKTQVVEGESFLILGKTFEGRVSSDAYMEIQDEVQRKWKAGELKGKRCVYFYNNPDTSKTVKAVIGVIPETQEQEIEGFSLHTFPAQKAIQTELYTSRWIAPNPQEMYVQMVAFAQKEENDLQISSHLLEIHEVDKIIIKIPLLE